MTNDDRKARLRDDTIQPRANRAVIRFGGDHHAEAAAAEELAPQRQEVPRVHRQRYADGLRCIRRIALVVRVQQSAAQRNQVGNHRLAIGLGALAKTVGALIAPERLRALYVKLLY